MASEEPLFAEVHRVVDKIAAHRAPVDVGPETRLADDYWLDSIEMLEVLIECEAAFGVTFDERGDFDAGALRTLGSLTELLRSKLVARKKVS
jgi:acyl carrier protein